MIFIRVQINNKIFILLQIIIQYFFQILFGTHVLLIIMPYMKCSNQYNSQFGISFFFENSIKMELFKLFCNFYSEINKMAKDVKK